MAEERTRLKVLLELKQVQVEINKLEQEGAKKSAKAAKDLQTYREYELELMKESSKLLERNLKKYAAEEKSIGSISNAYQSLKTSQFETVNIAKSAIGLKDEEINQVTNLLSLSRDLSELTIEDEIQIKAKTTEYENALGNLSKNITGNKKLLTSLEKQNELALTYTKQTQTQKKVNEAMIDAQEKVQKTFQGISETVGITLQKLKSGRGAIGFLVLGAGKFAEKLGEANKQLGRVGEGLGGAYTTTAALGFLFDSNVESIKALSTEFGGLEKASDRILVSTNLIANNFGISATDAAKLQQQFAALNNGSIDIANNLIETTQQFALQNNLIPSALMADLAANTENFALFGKDGGRNILQAAGYAAKLGISLDKVAGVAENLLDFESSITKELELSALLGKTLNLDKARQLAFDNDIAGATQEVLRQIGGIAAFERMNYYQRKQTADLLGVSVEEFKKMALNQNKANSLGAIQTEQFSNQNEFLGMIGNKFAGTILKGAGNFLLLMALANKKTSMLAGLMNGIGKAITFLPRMMIKFIKHLVTANALTRAQKLYSNKQIAAGFGGKAAKDMLAKKLASTTAISNTASTTTATASATSASKTASVGASLKALAVGLRAMGTKQVLFGALNLIPTALGFAAMTVGAIGLAAVATLGPAAGVGLTSLASGMIALGASAKVALIGAGVLAAIGVATIPLTYALSLLAPLIDSVANGIVSFVSVITLEKAAAIGLLSLAFYGLAASLTALGTAGIFALPTLLGIAAAAGGLAIVADIFGIGGSSTETSALESGGETFEQQSLKFQERMANALERGHVIKMNGQVVGKTIFGKEDESLSNNSGLN
jgi:hypothetical protein